MKPSESTSTTISSVPINTNVTSTLDDLTKNRFDKYQGSQSSYSTETSKPISSTIGITSSTSSIASSGIDSTKTDDSCVSKKSEVVDSTKSDPSRSVAAKYAFGRGQYSTGSMSDSEIIFGSTDVPDENFYNTKRSFGRNSFTTSVDGNDSADTIYASKRESTTYNRSLSVSSDVNGDFANDPRVNTTYRIYEGIQNAAFQDFDSPVKTSTSTIPTTSDTSNTYTSYSNKIYSDDDDYDLK